MKTERLNVWTIFTVDQSKFRSAWKSWKIVAND